MQTAHRHIVIQVVASLTREMKMNGTGDSREPLRTRALLGVLALLTHAACDAPADLGDAPEGADEQSVFDDALEEQAATGESSVVVGAGDLVVAPGGASNAPGTLQQPTSLASALQRIGAGHRVYLRGGTYRSAAQITIERSNRGAPGSLKQLVAYGSEKPILDFSSERYGQSGNQRGLQLDGSYWHIKGLVVQGAADNGIYVSGSNNVIESCVTRNNRDTGLQLGRAGSSTSRADWPANNLILNCESYDNYDAPPGSGENADGFAAKLTVGNGNVFRGCVAHHNIDDGWDLFARSDTGAIGPVTIDQCIAYSNGSLTTGRSNSNGDRNGFKLGGSRIAVAHVVTRSIAYGNGAVGFTWNSNPGSIRLSNNLAFDNTAGNYRFGDGAQTKALFTNNVSFWSAPTRAKSDKVLGTDVSSSNRWWQGSGGTVTSRDFALSLTKPVITRAADGTLDLSIFRLAPTSRLIDAGIVPSAPLPFDVKYYRGRPDLGAVETQ